MNVRSIFYLAFMFILIFCRHFTVDSVSKRLDMKEIQLGFIQYEGLSNVVVDRNDGLWIIKDDVSHVVRKLDVIEFF